MTQSRIRLVIAMLLWMATGGNAGAQPQASADKWAAVTRLAPGTQVRIDLSSGKTAGGTLQNAATDSVTIQSGAGQETLPRTQIGRVQVKGGGRRGRHALIGMAIGAGGGLAIGAALDSHDKGSFVNVAPNFGKAAITPLGAIIGGVVGLAIPSGGWREVYRATSPPRP